jgi:dihydrolipoamide dehydrogenase
MIYDIAIIGAGPGGYVAAIRAAQLGARVVLVEKGEIGGVCLNRGCIPSKAVITSVDRYIAAKNLSKFGIKVDNVSYDYGEIFARKEKVVQKLGRGLSQLIKANGIEYVQGTAGIESADMLKEVSDSGEQEITFKHLIIATGSRTASLPGIETDHKFVLDTDDILRLETLPESVLVVGSGASGIEWTRIFSGLGKKVAVVEIAQNLAPMFDISISEAIGKAFKRKKMDFYTGVKVEKVQDRQVFLSNGVELTPDIVFLAAGRAPNTDIPGIEKLNLEMNGRFFKVDSNLRTTTGNIYAIGDVNGLFPVAHVASHQGVKAVEHILLGHEANINYLDVPSVIYGAPEMAGVGYTENQLVEKGIPFKKSVFPMGAIGKAVVEEEIEGFVKILANDQEILGAHVVSDNGAELVQQIVIAKSAGVSPEKLKDVIFAHPTLSEAVHESVLGVFGEALHIPPVKEKL